MHLFATRFRHHVELRKLVCPSLLAVSLLVVVPAVGQQVQYPSTGGSTIQSGVSTGSVGIPQTNLTPIAQPTGSYPPASGYGQLNPYATSGVPASPGTSGVGPVAGPALPGGSSAAIGPPVSGSTIAPRGSTIAPGGVFDSSGAIPPSPPGSSLLGRLFTGPSQPAPGFGTTYVPSQTATVTSQPTYVPGQPTYVPGQPTYAPGQPTLGVGQPTLVPGQTAAVPGQPAPIPSEGPVLGGPNYGAPVYGVGSYGAPTGPVYGSPPPQAGLDTSSVYGPPPVYGAPGSTVFPSTVYPSSTPTVLFPSGLFPDTGFAGSLTPVQSYDAFRIFQGPRLRHEFTAGGDKVNSLGVNNTDVSLVFAFPNFLYADRPLFVIPSFSLHLWDGPNGVTGADLPPNAYSGFLDIGWDSAPNAMFSTEMGIRFGIFTDFNTNNSESFRVLGKALVNFGLTPTSSLKGGVYYLDRNSIKLVPALGVICRPNPLTRWDIYYPLPRFSRYCRTIGTQDVWWYLAGDFGGGSWTVKRTDGTSDSIDINELRAVFGIEWGNSEAIRIGRRTAFFETGYVFNREIEYRHNPQDNIDLEDGWMFRVGIGY